MTKLTYRFIRTAAVKVASDVPAALQLAGEVCAHLKRKYERNVNCGVELFGECRIHWHSEGDSLDKLTGVFAELMQDREYLAMVEKSRALWVEGSVKDSIVAIAE